MTSEPQFLIVRAANRSFAIPSESVREITTLPLLTRLPGASQFVRGVANVRGQFFVVVDLADRVFESPTQSPEPDVVVVTAEGKTLGVLVDEVREVVGLADTASPPVAGGAVIGRMGHFGDSIVLVVDVSELIREVLV